MLVYFALKQLTTCAEASTPGSTFFCLLQSLWRAVDLSWHQSHQEMLEEGESMDSAAC